MGKPQPVDTIDVDDRYVEAYERSHANATVDYKLGYREYFTVDSLLPSPYSALIAGCGTLGAPFNLLRGAGRIVGVDRSAKMLASASRLSQRAVGKGRGIKMLITKLGRTRRRVPSPIGHFSEKPA